MIPEGDMIHKGILFNAKKSAWMIFETRQCIFVYRSATLFWMILKFLMVIFIINDDKDI